MKATIFNKAKEQQMLNERALKIKPQLATSKPDCILYTRRAKLYASASRSRSIHDSALRV